MLPQFGIKILQLDMTNKPQKIFEEVENKARLLARYWNKFRIEISKLLPETYQSEMNELSEKLENSLDRIVEELRNPTLTLATTGTTSSGKSTLVNLLCGAEIVPVAVAEMSAGAVTIEFSQEKSLTIHETPGAVWETGEWRGIDEDDIYDRLHETMISYLENRQQQPNLACPQSTIGYPFRLVKESNLELPQGTKVRILDLPGLAYVGDEGNASIIRQCREALCIVTYNSFETDSQKVRSLLQEVVEQVKDLGGSPARMLFVLNRIDVFRADRDWPETENRFVTNTINDIKSELTEQLKEYTEEIEKLEVVKLSTWPALLALQIKSDSDIDSIKACKKADNNFNGLIEEDVLDDLPRKPQKWSLHDRKRVSDALWKSSYADEFHQHLRGHIFQHFPQLVIPQAIERFNVAAGNAVVEWSQQTVSAILNSSEEQYQQECENISRIRLELRNFLETSDRQLREPFEKIDETIGQVLAEQSEVDPVQYLIETLSDFRNAEPYNSLGEKLLPLWQWRDVLGKAIEQVLEAVAESLENGNVNLDNIYLRKAKSINVNLLENNLNRLIGLGYTGSTAKEGRTIEARTDGEKDRVKQLNFAFNDLALNLNNVMENVLEKTIDQELERIFQAVLELFNCHLSYLQQEANNIAPKMAIKFPESELAKVEKKPQFNLKFQAGFAITQGSWEESVQVAVRRRVFWKLWLGKATKYETRYETRKSDNAEIPKVDELLIGWSAKGREAQIEIVNQIADWLLEQINFLKKNVDLVQDDVLNRYQARLDKANQEITLNIEEQRNTWQPMQQKAQTLAEEFSSLELVIKQES